MPIEIKELIIKTTILNGQAELGAESVAEQKVAKEEILSECRQMMLNLLREHKER